jgi:hypothetical protein
MDNNTSNKNLEKLTAAKRLSFLQAHPDFRYFLNLVDEIGVEYMQILLDLKRPERELFTAQGVLEGIRRVKLIFEQAKSRINNETEKLNGPKQPNRS